MDRQQLQTERIKMKVKLHKRLNKNKNFVSLRRERKRDMERGGRRKRGKGNKISRKENIK